MCDESRLCIRQVQREADAAREAEEREKRRFLALSDREKVRTAAAANMSLRVFRKPRAQIHRRQGWILIFCSGEAWLADTNFEKFPSEIVHRIRPQLRHIFCDFCCRERWLRRSDL